MADLTLFLIVAAALLFFFFIFLFLRRTVTGFMEGVDKGYDRK